MDEQAGATITVKKRKGKGKSTGRQTKLTGTTSTGNSLKITKPSPFAETVEPTIPEFNAQPKKASGKGPGRPKVKKEKETSLTSEPTKPGQSPEKLAAAKAVKDAFGLSDDETPPASLSERLAAKKPSGKQTTLKFPKKKAWESEDDTSEEEDMDLEFDTPPPIKKAPPKAKVCACILNSDV